MNFDEISINMEPKWYARFTLTYIIIIMLFLLTIIQNIFHGNQTKILRIL